VPRNKIGERRGGRRADRVSTAIRPFQWCPSRGRPRRECACRGSTQESWQMAHGVNANQVLSWRRVYRQGLPSQRNARRSTRIRDLVSGARCVACRDGQPRLPGKRREMDDRGHFEPQEVAFVVVIGAPAPVGPASRKPEALANRRIEQRPPRPAGAAQAERRGNVCDRPEISSGPRHRRMELRHYHGRHESCDRLYCRRSFCVGEAIPLGGSASVISWRIARTEVHLSWSAIDRANDRRCCG
jgi:hypothetical protein